MPFCNLRPALLYVKVFCIYSVRFQIIFGHSTWNDEENIYLFSKFLSLSPPDSNSNIHPFSESESDPVLPQSENILFRPDKFSTDKQKTSSNIFQKNKAPGFNSDEKSKPRFVFRAPPPFVWSNFKKNVSNETSPGESHKTSSCASNKTRTNWP